MGLTLQKLEQSPFSNGPIFWLFLLIALCFGFQRANALSSNQISVTNKSGTRFILDSNSPCTGPRAAYVAYQFTNTTNVVLTGLNANLNGLSSGFALAGGQPALQSIGTLAPNASVTLFWYISYPCSYNQSTNISITVSDSNPGTRSFSFNSTTRSSVSSTGGGLLISRSIGAGLTMGQTTHVDVEYDLGNVPNNGFAYFQPGGNSDFNAGCLKLIGSQVLLSAIPAIVPVGSTNTLNYIASASGGGGSNRIVIRYTFQVACASITSVMKPYAASNNGNQVKHTSNYGGILVNIPTDFPPANPCLSGSQDAFAALQTNTGIDATGDNWSASWGDYNNDGFPDLFIATNDPKQPNALYRNNGNSTFTKVTTAPFSTDAASSMSSSWGDYDNDGDLDLYVANNIGFENFLYRNEGGGNFTKILNDPIVADKGYSHGVSWADYDNDGFLDMFVAVYWETSFNKLYHNNGDGTFSEVTNHAITNEASRSVSGAWGDYDNDGLQDLFVANTGGQNNSLYHNLGGGKFERITTGIVVNDGGSSVGANWADYNNDGYLDLFVTNAGNEPCYLYKNTGGGLFKKIEGGTITTDRGDAHGSAWADWDNDGDLDLFVARDGRNNSLYRNDGNDVFSSIQNDATDDGGLSFGAAWADYDRDGDLDLFVANRKNSGNFFYKNTRGTCNAWTSIKLAGTGSNRSAIGARVTLTAVINGQTVIQTRVVQGQTGGGTGGQNDLTLSFGLGNATTINSIVVTWPSGYRQTLINQLVNQRLTITEDNLSEVSGQVYYEENLVCTSGLPTPPAASQTATYRTAKAGDWSSASTWVGGNVPAYNSINNRTISIEHDVTIPNGNIYITGPNTKIWITNAKLKMGNGNLTMDRGSLQLLGATLEMNNGNFDITGAAAYVRFVQTSVSISGNHTSIGKKYWESASLQVTGSYINGGPDTLTNVRLEVRGNFQNYIAGNMVVNNARVHVTNGEFQNLGPAVCKGSGLVIWLETGNIQNYSIWTAAITQYCTPSWAIPVGILPSYLPSAKNCATIAAQFVDNPSIVAAVPVGNKIGVPYAKVLFQPGDITVYADQNGYYTAFLPAGSYTAQQVAGSNFQAKCPNTSGTQNVTISGPGQVYASRDFGSIPMSTLPDLYTEIVITAHRIGANNLLVVNYENMGLSASENTILEVEVPDDMEILLTSIPQLAAKARTLSFDLGTVPANGKGVVLISYSVTVTTPVGKIITVASNIGGANADANAANNKSSNTSNAVASYDPNDISVSPGRYFKRDEWLHYTIRFQNVGNFPAGLVRVEDELPEGLDFSTLEMGGVSHTYRLQAQGRKLVWTFPNIDLPDSLSNEAESHGYISFRIKAKENLALGDRLLNRAAIFFDNLEPVITNTVESILTGQITKETRSNAKPLQVFPNPTSGKVTVQSFDLSLEPDAFFVEISVYDQFGRQVFLAKDVATQRQELALYELTAGNYYVKALDSKGRVYTGTIVLLKN